MQKLATVCMCVSRKVIDKRKENEVVAQLKKEGYLVTMVDDLCEIAITSHDQMRDFAHTKVVACYPRAVKSLFDAHGLSMSEEIVEIRNHPTLQSDINFSQKAEAWFPVIDKERCTECSKCHDFCLFGVYSVEDGVVKVTQPRNCKNNCPACARVCPSRAVIFPKYEKSPINGGLEDEEQITAVDSKALYAERLRYKLEERKNKISLLKKQ